MCNPLLVTAGLSAFQYVSGQQTAKATAKAQKAATAIEYQALADQEAQTNDAAAQSSAERIKMGMLERSKMAAIAGETGAMGISSDRLIADSFFQEGIDLNAMESNRSSQVRNLGYQQHAGQARGQSSVNQAYAAAPSLVGTGLQIGADIYKIKGTASDKAKEAASAKAKKDATVL